MKCFILTKTHKKLVVQTTDQFKRDQALKENIVEGLKMVNPRTPKFYTTHKIHITGNPGRPAVSSIKKSEFVGFHQQPIATEIPFYVLDIKPFLNKIKLVNNVLEETDLVTMDLKSLYSKILSLEGIAAAKEVLSKESNKTVSEENRFNFISVNTNTEQLCF